MKQHTKNGGHRKDARKNHGERARGNLNKSDLHNPTELHCLCMEYSILTTLTIQPLPFFVSSLECSLFWYLRQIEQIKWQKRYWNEFCKPLSGVLKWAMEQIGVLNCFNISIVGRFCFCKKISIYGRIRGKYQSLSLRFNK